MIGGRPIHPGLIGVAVAGVAVGVLSFAFARNDSEYALAGASVARAVIELAAGYALIAVAIRSWIKRPQSRFGALLAAAAIGWLLAEWNNPGIGSSLAFTIGLASYVAAPPLLAHAVLAYPGGRLSSRIERVGMAFSYLGALIVLGLLPALFFDPAAAGCAQCPENVLLVDDSPRLFEDLNRIGVDFGLAWSLALIGLLALHLFRSREALRRLIWPVLAAGAAYMGLVAAEFVHSLDRGFLSNDATDIHLRLAQAGSLLALALAVASTWLRARRTRGDIARLVVELASAPAPGTLRDALAEELADDSLALGYPLADGRLVDARGRAITLDGDVTRLVREGEEVARLSHRPGLLDDPGLVEEVTAAARLALENERLRAEAAAQLEDLRASRVRVIAAGDAERRRLERDLHDGAQQQLVGLALSLRLARSGLGPNPDPALVARIEAAEVELATALAELRELAQGIFPAVLTDEGLAAAVEALVEGASIPIEVTTMPEERFEDAVEAAACFVVSETLRRGAASALTIAAAVRDGQLVIEVEGDRAPEELTEVEDRVGALDGSVVIAHGTAGRVTVRAEIPCES